MNLSFFCVLSVSIVCLSSILYSIPESTKTIPSSDLTMVKEYVRDSKDNWISAKNLSGTAMARTAMIAAYGNQEYYRSDERITSRVSQNVSRISQNVSRVSQTVSRVSQLVSHSRDSRVTIESFFLANHYPKLASPEVQLNELSLSDL